MYGKIIERVLSHYVTSLYSRVRSPPYCCAVSLYPYHKSDKMRMFEI